MDGRLPSDLENVDSILNSASMGFSISLYEGECAIRES
jgi:hypothetical protein